VKVDGFAFFYRAIFAGRVSFRNASFENLYLDSAKWPAYTPGGPPMSNSVRLEGMSYRRIRSITNEEFRFSREQLDESWRNLKQMLKEHTPYTFDVYDSLERYFRQEGEADIADEVFIEGKEQERKQVLERYSRSWCLSLFLDWTVGFGRRPMKAAYWSAGFITVGFLFFCKFMKRKGNSTQTPHQTGHWRQRFTYGVDCGWYSLGLFLPVVDLKIHDLLEPKPEHRWILWYVYMHTIMGYVLVPIWVAALAGLIK